MYNQLGGFNKLGDREIIMAMYDFTGNDGDSLPAGITTISGTSEIWQNKARAKTVGANNVCEILVDGEADTTVSGIYNAEGMDSNTGGIIFRAIDSDNFFLAGISASQGSFRLMRRFQGGSFTVYTTYLIPDFDNAKDYLISATTSGDDISISLDGVERGTYTTTVFNTESKHGFRFADTFSTLDDLNVPTGATSLTVSEVQFDNFVFQRDSDGFRNVSFMVSYGGADEPLEYRLLDARDGTTEVQTWQVFDNAPTGGGSTLSFNWVGGLIPILVEVRKNTETAIQTKGWYVGVNALLYGQSLAELMSTQGTPVALDHYFENKGAGNVVPNTGLGARELAKKIQDMYSCAVVFVNSAFSGSDLTEESAQLSGKGSNWWANNASSLYVNTVSRVDNMTNSENKLEFALWIQGQTDAVRGITEENYLRLNDFGGLNTLFTNSRVDFKSNKDGRLSIISSTLGRNTSSSTDVGAQGVRNAILTMTNCDKDVYPMPIFNLPTYDGTHPTDAGSEEMGRYAATILHTINSGSEELEIFPIAANVSGSDLVLTLNKNIDTNVTSYSTEGILVTETGVNKTVTGFNQTAANELTFTLSSPILDQSDLMVYYPYGTGATSGELTYPATTEITLPNSGGVIKLPINNFALEIKQGV